MPNVQGPSASPPSQTIDIRSLLAKRRNYREEVLAAIDSSRHVAFYGCGAIFGSILETWQELVGRSIDFCCDSDPSKWGTTFYGVPCISPQELESMKNDVAVFVTVGDFEPVLEYLLDRQFPKVQLIYKYDLVSSDYLTRQDLEMVADKLERVRSMLADDKSLDVFNAILRRLLDPESPHGLMADVCEGDQYFPSDLISLNDHESFVDAGAYNGDTASDFLRRTNGRFDSIHCFELDAVNFKALEETMDTVSDAKKIALYPVGLWNEPMNITYNVGKSQSTVGAGSTEGKVVRLDDTISDVKVTFLKMDIEGAEGHALEGSRQTIARNKPTLALCVYHHLKDLWEIPCFVKDLIPEYQIYLRHHTKLEYETVCYAIPSGNAVTTSGLKI